LSIRFVEQGVSFGFKGNPREEAFGGGGGVG